MTTDLTVKVKGGALQKKKEKKVREKSKKEMGTL
jgi:hypothetical protein